MSPFFNTEQSADLLKRGFSRRSFGRLASVITAGAALPFYNERALAQLSMVKNIPADAVKINANENPMGPCPEAADAIYHLLVGLRSRSISLRRVLVELSRRVGRGGHPERESRGALETA